MTYLPMIVICETMTLPDSIKLTLPAFLPERKIFVAFFRFALNACSIQIPKLSGRKLIKHIPLHQFQVIYQLIVFKCA